jgi:hypothetical protein
MRINYLRVHHKSVPVKYEHYSSKSRGPSGMSPKWNGDFFENGSSDFDKHLWRSLFRINCLLGMFKKITVCPIGPKMVTQIIHRPPSRLSSLPALPSLYPHPKRNGWITRSAALSKGRKQAAWDGKWGNRPSPPNISNPHRRLNYSLCNRRPITVCEQIKLSKSVVYEKLFVIHLYKFQTTFLILKNI